MVSLQSVATQSTLSTLTLRSFEKIRSLPPSQKTIAHKVSCQGIGVHSGLPVTLTLSPAFSDNGIIFSRTDLGGQEIKAHWDTVIDTRMCTTIGNRQGITVSTVEHLMAALAAQGIDNIRIELNGSELPIMDGSSAPFMRLLEEAGIRKQRMPRKLIRVLKTITVENGNQKISLSPSSSYEIEVEFDFDGRTSLQGQKFTFRPFKDNFEEEIAPARTFGLLEDAQKIWAMGLAKGASLDNTLVYEGSQILNEEGTRYADECVRHKILDVLGDLHLAGGLILGKVHGIRPSHTLNSQLLHALFADPSAWVEESAILPLREVPNISFSPSLQGE